MASMDRHRPTLFTGNGGLRVKVTNMTAFKQCFLFNDVLDSKYLIPNA